MKVLLTGADGYIGVRMAAVLLGRGHDVTGLDAGFHRAGWLYDAREPRPAIVTKDIRDVTVEDLRGFKAVVHCAEISNDPVGQFNPECTYKINHRGTLGLATAAKAAGVQRFVHMSSCSVYGASGDSASKEGDPTEPLTAYADCKLLVERDVCELADDTFAPTFLRNATAFGASPRQRFDLVVNFLAATAFLYREIRMESDGTPWRPFVHILDISKAVGCVLEADLDLVQGEIYNVGDNAQNYQIREVAQIISDLVPGCRLIVGDSSNDKRNYRADFTKINTQLPGFSCDWDAERGAAELLQIFDRVGFDEQLFEFRGHTRLKQLKYLLGTGQINDDLLWV